jgi:hypothetical protein
MSATLCTFAVTLNTWRPSPPVQKLLFWLLSKTQTSIILLVLCVKPEGKWLIWDILAYMRGCGLDSSGIA